LAERGRRVLELPKSPSGSLCPYYYMGGELHPLKYGGFAGDRQRLFTVIKAEEVFILESPGEHNRRIWVDLYDTALDSVTVAALVDHFEIIRCKILKLCLVGCAPWARHRIRATMRRRSPELRAQTRYFSDPEQAKQWLVGRGMA
jgi:hypothetical protein